MNVSEYKGGKMKRNYDVKLIAKMKQNENFEFIDNLAVTVKPIPEGGAWGDMDPRLYQSMKRLPLIYRFMPKPKQNLTIHEKVKPLRKMFADYKGIQMVTEGVITKEFCVNGADGHQIPIRLYKRTMASEKLPILVYYHGGGFFGGSADIVEQLCKLLVSNFDCAVLNVTYRLCPENHYPAPLDDCYNAAKWAYENAESFGGDQHRIAVGGDSAGGNLAAAVTLRNREEKANMVKLQVLIYPAVSISGQKTEFYHGVDLNQFNMSKKHEKVLKTVLRMMTDLAGKGSNLLEEVYLQGYEKSEHIFVSPLNDDMHDLPPTLILFGEHDFLMFEDLAYAQTLNKAGRTVKTILYRGIGHGFADQIGVLPQAEDCVCEIAKYMSEVL